MGVNLTEVTCLAMDGDDIFSQQKACIEDIVTVSFKGGIAPRQRGTVVEITDDSVTLYATDFPGTCTLELDTIELFTVDFRGELSRKYFG